MHYELIAKKLKSRRELLRISQEELSEISGVGLRTIKKIETGKGNPTIITLQKLLFILGLEMKIEIRNNEDDYAKL